ncbi:helix-turn-helix transcriptional regulator [Bacillus sp. FJAT-45350]|uniref:helix-turn-helix transcriptional regulator n=1 Tax=Bacillus sp. FJAT-45350 TaxID=2011014 RepID=UPI000BB6D1EA|nr:helix-turn-helix transcriptional regulator [Bacillus sp. FJAT-45350]
MLISKIDECIKKAGFRRDYISDQMKVTKQQLSNWCTGRSKPKTEDLYKLALLLKCKTDDLYEYVEEEIKQ